jgi:hypothetical protein
MEVARDILELQELVSQLGLTDIITWKKIANMGHYTPVGWWMSAQKEPVCKLRK